ncbi:hypothetical protein PR048_018120 [Dryococelus australis]|uniref:Polyprotein n=1 Tax=Dryococelus australis TaxID=614101 RepID=A0ABQ9HBI6_9NEOP|nr:hypothetical protein PR048_018120 [Dryococelus australis]
MHNANTMAGVKTQITDQGMEVVKISTPRIILHINGTTYYAMLDTCCRRSCVVSTIITNHKLHTITDKFTIVGATEEDDFLLFDNLRVDAILGCDFIINIMIYDS